jgi:membrane protease YdiL (CAAX protease family)
MMESEHSVNLLSDSSSTHQEEIRFSRLLTVVCLMMCATGIGLLLWMVTFSGGLRLSLNESRDLERIASRMLGFEARLPELSSFEQLMFRLGGQDGETQEQIRLWYEEMVDEQSKPMDELYLGILYGEAGLTDQLNLLVVDGDGEGTPHALFRRLLKAGYPAGETSSADDEILQARLAEEVPTNWFYFQLAQRLADQSGDEALRAHLQSQFNQLTDLPLLKWRLLLVCEMVLIGIGLILFLHFGFTRLAGKVSQRSGGFEERNIPWTFQEGTAVLARGGALTIILMGVVAVLPFGPEILEDYGIAFLYLPSVILTSVLLCRPRHHSFLQVVGCRNVGQRLKYSVPLVVMVGTLGLVGDWFIVIAGDAFQSSVHWTEWFVPQLVWGSQMDLVKTAIEFVILAPVFEELIFRGILFATLRKRFSFLTSMFASGLIFALAHGYGVIAFLTVLWSGCLWAWAYERTGSVIPGMLAHAVNNGVVVYSLVAFFR